MSSSSDLLTIVAEPQPLGTRGRRASVLVGRRPVRAHALPDLADLGDPVETLGSEAGPSVPRRRDAGWDAGFAAGRAAGEAELVEQIAAERAALLQARIAAEQLVASLGAAVEEARRQRAVALDAVATELATLAVELATTVVGREVSTGADALTRALALAPARATGIARLHPDDLAGLEVRPDGAITLQGDPTVERGGCVLDLPDATIDAQLGTALDRVRAALLEPEAVAW